MKTVFNFLLIALFVCTAPVSFAQENVLQLDHQERGVTRTIKENKRVRVKTIDGQKYKGRLVIVDANTISLNDTPIPIASIEKIKRDPLLLSTLATTGFVYLGIITVGVGVIVAIFIDGTSAAPFIFAGGGLGALGILNPSYIPAKKMARGWSISVQEAPTN